jgi:hypothetical protein
MSRKVFFSFHYDRDIWRAGIVRNHWRTKPDRDDAGYWDKSLWEDAKKKGDATIKRMIDNALSGTSVTAVLIGYETWERDWVKYEIEKSYERGNGLFGVYIHEIKDQNQRTDIQGRNPFDSFIVPQGNLVIPMSKLYPTYRWGSQGGCLNFSGWVEAAARAAGK